MQTVKLLGQPGKDTRGLPYDYDPHHFYEYGLQKRIKEATGLEGYIYQYIPHSIIKSFAIAFDPLSRVKVSLGRITPVNRTRYRATASILDIRSIRRFDWTHTYQSYVNWQGIGGNDGPVHDTSSPDNPPRFIGLTTQQPLPRITKDTTRRTRIFGSDTGEFEHSSAFISSPARPCMSFEQVSALNDLNISPTNPYPSKSGGRQQWNDTIGPTAATLSLSTYNNWVSYEKDYALALLQKHCLAMFKDCNPQSRNYSFFRELVELRDLPRSVLSLKETISDLRKLDASLKMSKDIRQIVMNLKTNAKHIPNEYLSYHFGWKQTYKAVIDLLTKPQQISKQINLLIERNGKPTTYRTKRKYVSGDSGVSGFDYDLSWNEDSATSSSRIDREVELRMVINTTFSFPPVDIPRLRYRLFTDKLGIYPRFTDIYNLTPWTWLFDWFTGFGNYLDIIESIAKDKSLVNWAFITSETEAKLVTDFSSKSRSGSTSYYNGSSSGRQVSVVTNNHSSVCNLKFQLRKDLSTILDVKSTADVSKLSAYQQSILGALLSQRLEVKRSRHIGG